MIDRAPPHGQQDPRPTGAAEASRRVEDVVLRGAALPGERLNELALSRRFGVFRAVLREAVRGLEHGSALMRDAAADGRFEDCYARGLDLRAARMAASGNPSPEQAHNKAAKNPHLFRRRSLVRPAQIDPSLREHGALLLALTARDVDAAGEAAERHVTLGRDRMLDTLGDDPRA